MKLSSSAIHEVPTEPAYSHPLQNIYDSEDAEPTTDHSVFESGAKHLHKWTSIRFKHGN